MKYLYALATRLRWFAAALVVSSLLVTSAYLALIRSDLQKTNFDAGLDPTWAITELEFELLLFVSALKGVDDPEENVTVNDLRTRLTAFQTRMALTETRATRGFINDTPEAPDLLAQIGSLSGRAVVFGPVLLASNDEIRRNLADELTALVPDIHELSLSANRYKSGQSSVLRDTIESRSQMIAMMTWGLGAGALFIGLMFIADGARMRDLLSENEKLLQQTKDTLQEKTNYVGLISHEFRTPITAIRGALGLVKMSAQGNLDPKIQKLVTTAEENSVRLGNFVDDLLELERSDNVQLSYDLEPCDLYDVVGESVRSCESYAQQHQVTLRLQPFEGPSHIMCDRNRIIQVMNNLLSNASKFSHAGGHVDVSVERVENGFKVSVKDYGKGIPKERQHKVFEMFSQAHDGSKDKVKGSGLGLRIAQTIVEKHDGRIGFESTPGEGSTFHITLPEAFADARAATA